MIWKMRRRRHLYGDVYSSPGLGLRQKQVLMLAFLGQADMQEQLFGHLLAVPPPPQTKNPAGHRHAGHARPWQGARKLPVLAVAQQGRQHASLHQEHAMQVLGLERNGIMLSWERLPGSAVSARLTPHC